MIDFSSYQVIMLYLALGDEVSCDDMIGSLLDQDKIVLIPYGEGDNYEAVQLTSWDQLSVGKRGIPTIKDQNFRSDAIDCIVCPGRLFTYDGKRKGRGGGWYDRFLAKHPESHKIGLCRKDQVVDDIEQRSWDIQMDKIIIIS